MGYTNAQRWRLFVAIGVALVFVAYVARRTLEYHLDADVWYSMSPSTRQELTEIVLRRVTDDLRYQTENGIVYVVIDRAVDWEKAVTAIEPSLRRLLSRAAFGEIPRRARGIGISVTWDGLWRLIM